MTDEGEVQGEVACEIGFSRMAGEFCDVFGRGTLATMLATARFPVPKHSASSEIGQDVPCWHPYRKARPSPSSFEELSHHELRTLSPVACHPLRAPHASPHAPLGPTPLQNPA